MRDRIQHEEQEERKEAADDDDQPGQAQPVAEERRPVLPEVFSVHVVHIESSARSCNAFSFRARQNPSPAAGSFDPARPELIRLISEHRPAVIHGRELTS